MSWQNTFPRPVEEKRENKKIVSLKNHEKCVGYFLRYKQSCKNQDRKKDYSCWNVEDERSAVVSQRKEAALYSGATAADHSV